MSHFTEYQVRSFTFLFEQYAIDLSVNGLRTEHQFKDASTPEFPLISRLPVSELAALLVRRDQ